MKENISPEEKLLRLIRGQRKGIITNSGNSAAQQPTTQEALKQRKPNPSLYFLIHCCRDFISLRKIIVSVGLLSALYLTASFIYPLLGLTKISPLQIKQESINNSPQKTETESFESYTQEIKDRRIFGNAASASQIQAPAAIDADIVKDITLVGILAGDNPQAVIEDKKTQKTFYLTKGQFIGEIQIDDILEGKVILNYRGQKYELYL